MSDHDVQMAELATLNIKLEWCVDALKFLLEQSAGYVLETPVDEYENDEVEDEPEMVEVPVSVQQTCTHGQQAKRGNDIVCAKCGYIILAGSGIGGPASQPGRNG